MIISLFTIFYLTNTKQTVHEFEFFAMSAIAVEEHSKVGLMYTSYFFRIHCSIFKNAEQS